MTDKDTHKIQMDQKASDEIDSADLIYIESNCFIRKERAIELMTKFATEKMFEATLAGATAERQNAWNEALDALIDWAKEERSNMLPTWAASLYDDLIRKIKQLKHKQP